MMKWKVIKNPRSSSADRSLECLKNDVQQQLPKSNGNNNDSNNNVGGSEENNQDSAPPVKETNKQRDSSLARKSSIVATECINLRSFLGLTRQRSETNLSSLGLISTEPRRSRSEVRGVSCDRLAVGYHTTSLKPVENGKTRCSSPPTKSGCWLRGRKRERESRNPLKNNHDVFGKTIVTGSCSKRTSSKTRNIDGRTIVDGSDSTKQSGKTCSTKPSLEARKGKTAKRSGEDDIIEEEVIYSEIEPENVRGKLLEENKEAFKIPTKVIRKKGQAPKPQVTTELFRDTKGDVNLNTSSLNTNGSLILLNEKPQVPENRKQPRKNQTFNGRNQERKPENRAIQSVKMNNLKNNEKAMLKTRNKTNAPSPVELAEVRKEMVPLIAENKNEIEVCDQESSSNIDTKDENKVLTNNKNSFNEALTTHKEESFPFYIDTPDYSTLDSVNCNSLSTDDITYSKDDVVNCNTDRDENISDSYPLITSDNAMAAREISLSSILRDSSNESRGTDSEPKKTVRFEKMDLIEKYKRNKTESLMDTEDDADGNVSEFQPLLKSTLDVNSNEILPSDNYNIEEDTSESFEKNLDLSAEKISPNELTVNVLVRSPSPVPQMSINTPNKELPQVIVKKSFVLTVAKQEKGFKSLCANRKPEAPTEHTKNEQHISVTFLCSGPPSESWAAPMPEENKRLRSTSVPPRSLQPAENAIGSQLAMRGRSRERRSKERQHCKKNHKARKKDSVFVMPQAVIDELSQVLEKRKPSLDEITVHP